MNECVGLTPHSTHNRSLRIWVFPGNRLHWYSLLTTKHQQTVNTQNAK